MAFKRIENDITQEGCVNKYKSASYAVLTVVLINTRRRVDSIINVINIYHVTQRKCHKLN
jgi:hypothetical protein